MTFPKRTINDISLSGKTVLLRADYNVPVFDGKITNDFRLRASLPTLQRLLDYNCKIVIVSHLGRPNGKEVPELSLAPVADRLSELLGKQVDFLPKTIGNTVWNSVKRAGPGSIVLLENLRFLPGEKLNDDRFAHQLAIDTGAEYFIQDGFGVVHRQHASTSAITQFLPSVAGLLLEKEYEYLVSGLAKPKRPMLSIIGGAKVGDKLRAVKRLVGLSDQMFIGGAMANTFFAAEGHPVGTSLYESEQVDNARSIKAELSEKSCELVLPVDVVVADKLESGQETSVHSIEAIPPGKMALDIGPKTVELFKEKLSKAKTIVWNGPMGAFETKEFAEGTYAMVDILSATKALTVVGGGDTDRALHDKHALDKMGYVSTAGGAFLELLEGKSLPGVEALR